MKNGGALLVETLVNLGATKSFGVPGESYLPVLDALYDTQGQLDFVLCRNEGGASYMASAYGKLTGSPGICLVTRGPGATNASIGLHTAMQDSSPMILFVRSGGLPYSRNFWPLAQLYRGQRRVWAQWRPNRMPMSAMALRGWN